MTNKTQMPKFKWQGDALAGNQWPVATQHPVIASEVLLRKHRPWQSRCTVASSQHESALTFTSGSCYAGVTVMTMAQTIRVVYENGVLKPLRKVDIPEHQTLEIIILDDDLPLPIIAQVAEQGGSYNFLRHAAEDIYTVDDGEEI
jgi:predicted DNA-binding antitoxin AbrB/MazE fold protein